MDWFFNLALIVGVVGCAATLALGVTVSAAGQWPEFIDRWLIGFLIVVAIALAGKLLPASASAAVAMSVTSAMAESGGMVARFFGWLAPIAMIIGGGAFAVLVIVAEGMRSAPGPMPGENRGLLWCCLLVMVAGVGLTGINIWEAVR